MKKTKVVNKTAKGYAFVPENRLDLLTKVIKRLQTDGIEFDMTDVQEPREYGWKRRWPTVRDRDTTQLFGLAPPCPPFGSVPGTLVEWPPAEISD